MEATKKCYRSVNFLGTGKLIQKICKGVFCDCSPDDDIALEKSKV